MHAAVTRAWSLGAVCGVGVNDTERRGVPPENVASILWRRTGHAATVRLVVLATSGDFEIDEPSADADSARAGCLDRARRVPGAAARAAP